MNVDPIDPSLCLGAIFDGGIPDNAGVTWIVGDTFLVCLNTELTLMTLLICFPEKRLLRPSVLVPPLLGSHNFLPRQGVRFRFNDDRLKQ